jgi:pyruvate dehydrogenase E2 component (dihydrolipoamide acetyltransferase)
MTASALVPQFTIEVDVDFGRVGAAREAAKQAGREISPIDLLVQACAAALLIHPRVNASWEEDAIVEYDVVNVGIAVALDDGLISPAILGADRLALDEIAGERRRLTESAWAGTLSIEEAMSSTFTISNLGPLGITRFRALVVPPQAAILAVGATRLDGRTCLALSCDHRVLDGAPAAVFLRAVQERLESAEWVGEPDG